MMGREQGPAGTRWRRRELLAGVGAASLVTMTLPGCDILSTDPSGEGGAGADTGADGPKAKEAPALADRVAKGELPALEERLPTNPLVLEPVESVGQYGGTYENIWGDGATYIRHIGNECLVRWRPGTRDFAFEDLIPNVAENFEIESDGREFVFTLREGMKWSDGEPFTAEDIMFWWNDVTLNEELTPLLPTWLVVGDQPPEVTSPDELTVVFRFPEPNGLFLFTMASFEGIPMLSAPKHYMTEFHADYSDDAEQRAQDAGYDSWSDWFMHYYSLWEGGIENKPTLDAWVVTVPNGGDVTRAEVERNPYYWKVDSDGSQLPYLDRVVFTVTESEEVRQLQALDGTYHLYLGGGDSQGAALQDKPLFARGREEAGYHFIDLIPANMNQAVFAVNVSCKNEMKREVFLDKNFRIGLSHAINRQEVIDAVYVQQGEPWQAAPRPESKFYDEQMAKQFTEYDVDLANEYLDKVLPERGPDGLRLGPNGEAFRFQTDVAITGSGDEWPDLIEMLSGYFAEVGISMRANTISDALWSTRKDANEYEASIWHGDGGLDVILEPRWYIPTRSYSLASNGWWHWEVDPEDPLAVEPPESVRRQLDLYAQLRATVDAAEQEDLMRDVLAIAKDDFWHIGINLTPPGFGVVRDDFRNVPGEMLAAWMYPTPAPTNPCQFYIEKP